MTLKVKFEDYNWPMKDPEHRPYQHQKETSIFSVMNKRCFILNDLGCVDSETEFLSQTGWIRIADWSGEKVAQWDLETKRASFVVPTNFIKKPCDEFISFGGDMMLSPEHRVIGAYSGKIEVRSAHEVHTGVKPYLFRTFVAPETAGMPFTDDEIRVMVAYIADGSFKQFNYGKKVFVRLKNADKILRMRTLLNNAKIEFSEQVYETCGRTNFIFNPLLDTQEYTADFYSATARQLAVICDEVWRWDGRKKEGRHNSFEFSTMRKASADFIQYAFTATGYPTAILQSTKQYKYKAKKPRTRKDGEYTTMYIVAASMMRGKLYKSRPSEIVKCGDGFKYCFEVPNTFWIMRRNDTITITGNTGKTLSALWAYDFLMLNDKIKRVLISSPLSTLSSVWRNEIYYNFPHRKAVIAHGTREARIAAISSNADFVIINHDGLVLMEKEILKAKFDVLIIDELTAFKNIKTDRWKAAKNIADRCKAVVGMTAEPTPNSPVEAYAQAKLVNEANPFLPSRFTVFRDMVEVPITTHLSIPKDGYQTLVHRVLQPAIKFKRDDCIDIPPRQFIDMEIPMTAQQTAVYEKMRKTLVVEHREGLITAANAAVKALKLTQIAAGWVKGDDGIAHELDSKTRLDALFDIFQNTHAGKLVVFAAFRAAVEGIDKFFKAKKVESSFIHGSVSQTVRGQLIDRFQTGNLQVLVIQPQSTSHGITLTAADTIVWHSLVPSGEIWNQCNGRITRIGQKRKQTVISMLGCTAEKRIRSILTAKGHMSKEILDLFTTL